MDFVNVIDNFFFPFSCAATASMDCMRQGFLLLQKRLFLDLDFLKLKPWNGIEANRANITPSASTNVLGFDAYGRRRLLSPY